MKIEIVKNGIFPISFDKNNQEIKNKETYHPQQIIQTKGLFLGAPSLFLNLSLCNLKCVKREFLCKTCKNNDIEILETQVVANIIRNNIGNIKHLVITGGEPFLQVTALVELLDLIKDLNLYITIETNGTIYNQEIYNRVDYISIFPILSVFTPTAEKIKGLRKELKNKSESFMSQTSIKKHEKERINISVLQEFIDNVIIDSNGRGLNKTYSLNVYVLSTDDLIEFETSFLSNLQNWTPEDINIIYYGIVENLKVVEKCKNKGYNFTPLFLFDNNK